jgi:hypothetical protein
LMVRFNGKTRNIIICHLSCKSLHCNMMFKHRAYQKKYHRLFSDLRSSNTS